MLAMETESAPAGASADLGVTIEAQFTVGEYNIVILSARDSSGLETWLHQEHYNIPQGAERVLRPYVEAGTKFFVARVDIERVRFENGRALLSPLRFHYDSDEFNLPVRLGLMNSSGNQDLLVHILARGQRFETANYTNVFIPTNIRVVDAVRQEFGPFYDLLFRRAIASSPRSVVTEYSWDAGSCDPCPTEPLNAAEIMTLGADAIGGENPYGFVLTRLHYRYNADTLGEDLVFRAAPPIVGGRGMPDAEGKMTEGGATPGDMNNFQGRYVILHPWQGPIACPNPSRGQWGGPPDGREPPTLAAPNQAMRGGGGAPTLTAVGTVIRDSIPALSLRAGVAEDALPSDPGPPGAQRRPGGATVGPASGGTGRATTGGCASCSAGTVTPERDRIGAVLIGAIFLGTLIRCKRSGV